MKAFKRFSGNGNYRSGNLRSQNRSRQINHSRYNPPKFDPTELVKTAVVEQKMDVYLPMHKFADFNLGEALYENILACGFDTPTPIQDQVIKLILAGKDVVGQAATGTGKTAAFLIPIIYKLKNENSKRALIIAPTRELAMQIESDFRSLAAKMNLFSVLCIGGTSLERQSEQLKYQPQIVIGTPGRLKDLEKRGKLNLAIYNHIVLDEVDRMLDMGFIRDVQFLISGLRTPRQSLFFSATLPPKVKEIMHQFLYEPTVISIKSVATHERVDQEVIKIGQLQKIDVLHDLLIKPGFDKVLVFGRTKWGMEKLSRALTQRGFKTASIHGNKSQGQRERALRQFKQSTIQVLLATDIASRGLDIENVTHVINYDLPESLEDYIHRIGRTGRADKMGKAITFVE